jgi:hypothetical protein
MERRRWYPWLLRALWVLLALVAGPTFADALDGRSIAVRTTASLLLWAAWAVGVGATLFLHPVSLTLLRILAPAALVAIAWAAVDGATDDALGWASVAFTVLPVAQLFLPETGELFVNGPAYPNERRLPLRVPGALVLGPLEVAWALTAGLPVAAALLLAAERWVAGGVCGVLAVAAVAVLGRALHGLARRWVVFVPAGLVLHDGMSLADPVLFPKTQIASIGVAPADTDALDLTQRSPGLAIQVGLREPAPLVLAGPRGSIGETVPAGAVLFTPSRPGEVVAEANHRMGSTPASS